ncbi:MAG: acetoacetate decarboxylase family protein [Verrucomicrobiae bacterium]|nr:acetoacetate decarboxylase family protein [Verrucomicrobiae bacterium]
MNPRKRLQEQSGQHALVDGIPFTLPVRCTKSPVLMALFPINADKARGFMPGKEVSPLRFRDRGLLVVTVIDYQSTPIGRYIEYSVGIACNHGADTGSISPAEWLTKGVDIGQYVIELPVSSEISVKGGKGIWGMPKRQGSLNFVVGERTVSSQYDVDGALFAYIEMERPAHLLVPLRMSAANFCAFRGMLMKSRIFFEGRAGVCLLESARARFVLGDHPRAERMKDLEIDQKALMTAFIPSADGLLDDHIESWFLTYDQAPSEVPEGMESVMALGLSEAWPPAPTAPVPGTPVA